MHNQHNNTMISYISTCIQVPRFSFQEKKISGDRTHTLTSLVCCALPIEQPSPWEQAGGEEGYSCTSAVPITSENSDLVWNTPSSDDAVTVALS